MRRVELSLCAFCDKRLIIDHSNKTVQHELPTCAGYETTCAEFGLVEVAGASAGDYLIAYKRPKAS